MKNLIFILLALFLLQGCASMDHTELARFDELQASGVVCDEVVNAPTAVTLNLLPGFGDIYLATGDYANEGNWGAFALDFLMWPISIVWAMPQANMTANSINKKDCIYRNRKYVTGTSKRATSFGVEFGEFNQGSSQSVKSTKKYNMITVDSPEYKERYQ